MLTLAVAVVEYALLARWSRSCRALEVAEGAIVSTDDSLLAADARAPPPLPRHIYPDALCASVITAQPNGTSAVPLKHLTTRCARAEPHCQTFRGTKGAASGCATRRSGTMQTTTPVPRTGPSGAAGAPGSAPMVLRTAGLRKQFGRVTAVQDVSIAVQQGDVFGFLGPNGSG